MRTLFIIIIISSCILKLRKQYSDELTATLTGQKLSYSGITPLYREGLIWVCLVVQKIQYNLLQSKYLHPVYF